MRNIEEVNRILALPDEDGIIITVGWNPWNVSNPYENLSPEEYKRFNELKVRATRLHIFSIGQALVYGDGKEKYIAEYSDGRKEYI